VYGHGIEEMFQRMPAIDKIEAAVGWGPTIDLDTILEEVVDERRLSPAAAGRGTGSRP
jgi:hypothetical protein